MGNAYVYDLLKTVSKKGIQRGDLSIVTYSRRSGKSQLALQMLKTHMKKLTEEQWSPWRKTSSFIPRKSINGKRIFGFMYKRSRTMQRMEPHSNGGRMRPYRERQYATKKQLFELKLKGKE